MTDGIRRLSRPTFRAIVAPGMTIFTAPEKRYEGYIFDCDGTLAHSMPNIGATPKISRKNLPQRNAGWNVWMASLRMPVVCTNFTLRSTRTHPSGS